MLDYVRERQSKSRHKHLNLCAHVHIHVRPSDEGPTGWRVDLRNPESEQLESFFSAVSHSSRNTIPLLTPPSPVINDLDRVRGISSL